MKPGLSPFRSESPLHDFVAFVEGQACTCRTLPLKRQSGSHKTLSRSDWPDFAFAFHDGEEIGPRMLARIAKHTGLRPKDL